MQPPGLIYSIAILINSLLLIILLIITASSRNFAYKYFAPEQNKSELNWAQVCQSLCYSS